MRIICLCCLSIILLYGCVRKEPIVTEDGLLYAEGVVYLFDNDQNQSEAKFRLEKNDALLLWKMIRNGVPVDDQLDQGLGWFKFHLKNNKTIFVELGQSGIARYNSKIAKIALILFEQFIKIHLTDESGKQLNEPNIFNFPNQRGQESYLNR